MFGIRLQIKCYNANNVFQMTVYPSVFFKLRPNTTRLFVLRPYAVISLDG